MSINKSVATDEEEALPSPSCHKEQRVHHKTCCLVARQYPTIGAIPLLLFATLCVAGCTIVYSTTSSENDTARREALSLAEETGAWFSEQLDQAILPLFSLAQFASELDIFQDLPDRIGPKGAPGSLPFLPTDKPVPTHRNVTGVCTDPNLLERFNKIASTIKRNAGMEGVLVNLQLAPEAVVCLLHPVNNTEDFPNGIFMDNSGAIGHDLLNDPSRKFIAQATVPMDSVVIAGPVTLAQCFQCDPAVEKGFIARLPIASESHQIVVDGQPYNRWGFAVAIINWVALVNRSNIYENFAAQGLTFRLTRTDVIEVDGVLTEREVVLAQAPNWESPGWSTVTAALETTNNEWKMTVGYRVHRDKGRIMAVVAVAIVSSLLGILLYIVLAQKQEHADVQEEQAALLVKSAEAATAAERELNDYISHEVRNPLSAAIAATSFVNASLEQLSRCTSQAHATVVSQEETLASIREDMVIVDQSLHFINQLLRSMLDMHRAASHQIRLQVDTLSVRDDIFLPVMSMIYKRDELFHVLMECPENLCVQADRLRLQQIILNLAKNSTKFVTKGFIRLRAEAASNGQVTFYVEDSGPGIPIEKRSNLFQRYQQSMDELNQGTGVGLYLCKKLVDLMGGEIYLDESFVSGVEGLLGSRIVVKLSETSRIVPCTKLSLEDSDKQNARHPGAVEISSVLSTDEIHEETNGTGNSTTISSSESSVSLDDENVNVAQVTQVENLALPENLNILLVDDDRTLRKLVRRCLHRVVPTWNVTEASSGEMAVAMLSSMEETIAPDIIFMDQYMTTCASQSMKGTETTRQLRAIGIVEPIICGVSANADAEALFLKCGANAFWLKPFPCKVDELRKSLRGLVSVREQSTSEPSSCV
eukprot:scaffold6899_cov183-Amphora_coffeaeformis.AAC.8